MAWRPALPWTLGLLAITSINLGGGSACEAKYRLNIWRRILAATCIYIGWTVGCGQFQGEPRWQ